MHQEHQPQRPLTDSDLLAFTGDLDRYQHTLNQKAIYTVGVRYLAERAQAYCLIDAVVSYIGSPQLQIATEKDSRLASLQFWHLDVHEDKSATLTCRADSGVEPAITQAIPYTDFPLGHISLWLIDDGQYWTLMLPSEY